MHPETRVALESIGLTKNETKVYLALLQLSSATATEITQKSKVHRVNVYDALERLREKGLISTILKSTKRIYEAANPEQLLSLLKEKQTLLEQVMPSLEQEHKLQKEPKNVHYFFGVDGLMHAYRMMLAQKQTVYGIGGRGLTRKYLGHRYDQFTKERLAQGVRVRALYFDYTKEDKNLWNKSDLAEIRYLPDKYKTEAMVDMCGDLVLNLLTKDDEILVIIVENKIIADSYRQLFEFMWDHAKV